MPINDSITDVAGIRVGHWTNRRAATGCTVVLCPTGTVGGVDVRGAAPGTHETDLLRPENSISEVHAILLSGGSAFGLVAASGVTEELAERGVGISFGGHTIPIVPAAILFDLEVGRAAHPDADAGRRAVRRARGGVIEVGSVGAGTGATIAKSAGREHALKGGIGTASELLDSGVVVAALVALNAVGGVRDPRTGEQIAAPRGKRSEFQDLDDLVRAMPAVSPTPGENTTLAVVATNARLTKTQTNRMATVAHDGFGSAIWPVHTRADGDVVFALATGEVDVAAAELTGIDAYATRVVERAIENAVRSAESLADTPSVAEWCSGRGSKPRSR
jgi:L-aminopeptidase/D-esterase-like protein